MRAISGCFVCHAVSRFMLRQALRECVGTTTLDLSDMVSECACVEYSITMLLGADSIGAHTILAAL